MLMNSALSDLLPADAPLDSPLHEGEQFIPPRFTSQGGEGRVNRRASQDRVKRSPSSARDSRDGSPHSRASVQQDSVWFEYGTV